jgi:putative PIN family toxin of toxin-antitoxin system
VKIKAILDTNVFISGVFWKGPPFEILKAWQEQRFRLAVSPPILDEYRRVLDEMMKKRSLPVPTSILRLIELHSEMVEPVSFAQPVYSDPDDDKFLEAALAAHAGYVVSGDAALLNVKLYRGIEIVRPARYLTLLLR